MIFKNKKLLYGIFLIFCILVSNYTSIYISKYYTTKWYEQYIAETAILPSGHYKLRTNRFENVLYINNIHDTTYKKFSRYRKVTILPCITKIQNGKIFYVDISNDYLHKGRTYYSESNYLFEISNGDTLWIDGKISEIPDSLTGIFPFSVSRQYFQYKYTQWVKDYFSQMSQ
jgi:hypothetical protein